MKSTFQKINEQEKNENTALILMLGVLGEELTDITNAIVMSNKLLKEILSCLKTENKGTTKEIIIVEPLKAEDYMD